MLLIGRTSPPLRRRKGRVHKRLAAILVAAGLAFGAPAALAEYPVIDISAIKQAVEQLNQLKKQVANQLEELIHLKEMVSFLNDISSFANDITRAIGKITNMKIPIPNLDRMSAQTKGNLSCLIPDGLKWGIAFEDLNFGSICETSNKYRQSLFADKTQMSNLSWADQKKVRDDTETHRQALLEDTATRALAQADVQMKQAEETDKTADKLQESLDAAETLQDRAHVQAQIEVAKLRVSAQHTQLLAQLVKLQAAVAIMSGLPASQVDEIQKGGGK